jgi:cob(I)alamin adenosyltransferase
MIRHRDRQTATTLSDLLFVAARYQAKLSDRGDLLWDSHGY